MKLLEITFSNFEVIPSLGGNFGNFNSTQGDCTHLWTIRGSRTSAILVVHNGVISYIYFRSVSLDFILETYSGPRICEARNASFETSLKFSVCAIVASAFVNTARGTCADLYPAQGYGTHLCANTLNQPSHSSLIELVRTELVFGVAGTKFTVD